MNVQNVIRSSIFLLSFQIIEATPRNTVTTTNSGGTVSTSVVNPTVSNSNTSTTATSTISTNTPTASGAQATTTNTNSASAPSTSQSTPNQATPSSTVIPSKNLFGTHPNSTAQQIPAGYEQMIFVPTIPTTSLFAPILQSMYASTDISLVTLQQIQQVYFVLEYFTKLEKIQHDRAYYSLKTKYASLITPADKDIPYISQGIDLSTDPDWQKIKITQQDVINSDMWQYFLKATIADIFIHNGNFLQVIHEVESQIFSYIPSMETSYYNSDFLGLRNLAEGTRLKLLLNDIIGKKHQAQCVDWAKLAPTQLQSASNSFQSTDFYTYSHNINAWMQQDSKGNLVGQKKVELQSPTREQVFCYAMIKAAQNNVYAALATSNNLENFMQQASSSSLLPNIFEYTLNEYVYLDDFFMIQANLATQIAENNQPAATATSSSNTTNSNSVQIQSLHHHDKKKKHKKRYKPEELVEVQDARLINPSGAANPRILQLEYVAPVVVTYHTKNLNDLTSGWNSFTSGVTSAAENIPGDFEKAGVAIGQIATAAGEAIGGGLELAVGDTAGGQSLLNQANDNINASGIVAVGEEIKSTFINLGSELETGLIDAGYAIRNGVIQAGYAIRDGILSAAEAVGGLGATVIGDIRNDPNLKKIGTHLTQQSVTNLQQAGQEIDNAIDDFGTAIEDGIIAPLADIDGAMVSILTQDQSMGLDVTTMINQISDSLVNIVETYDKCVVGAYIGGIADAIVLTTDLTNAIVTSLAAMRFHNGSDVGAAWTQLGNDMGSAILGAFNGLVNATKDMFSAIMQTLTYLTSAITTIIIDVSKEATFAADLIATGSIQEAKSEEQSVGTYLDNHRQTIDMVSGIILAVAIDVAVTVATGGAGTAEAIALDDAIIAGAEAAGETAAETGAEAGAEIGAEAGAEAGASAGDAAASAGSDGASAAGDNAESLSGITRAAPKSEPAPAPQPPSAEPAPAPEAPTPSSVKPPQNPSSAAGSTSSSTASNSQEAISAVKTAATNTRTAAQNAKTAASAARTTADQADQAATTAEQAASAAEESGSADAAALRQTATTTRQAATKAEQQATQAEQQATQLDQAATQLESAANNPSSIISSNSKDGLSALKAAATNTRTAAQNARTAASAARTTADEADQTATAAEEAATAAEQSGDASASALRQAATKARQSADQADKAATDAEQQATQLEKTADQLDEASTKAEEGGPKEEPAPKKPNAKEPARSWNHVMFSEAMNMAFNVLGAIGASYQDELSAVQEISQEEGVKNIASYAVDTALNSTMQQNAMMQESEKKFAANLANQQIGLTMFQDFITNTEVSATYQSEAVGLGQEYTSLLTPAPYTSDPKSPTYYPADIGSTWGLTTAINCLYPQLGLYTTTTGRPLFPYAQEIAQAPLVIDSQSGTNAPTGINAKTISQLWFNQRVMIPLPSQKVTSPLQVEMQFRTIYALKTTTYTGLYLGGTFENYRSQAYLNSLESTGMANLNVTHLAKMFVLINLPNGTCNIGLYEKDGLGTIQDPNGTSWIIYEPLDKSFTTGWPIYDMQATLQNNQLTLSLNRIDVQNVTPWTKTVTVTPTDQRMLGVITSGTAIEWNILKPKISIQQIPSVRANPSAPSNLPITIVEKDREIQSLQSWTQLLSQKFGPFKLSALNKFQCMKGNYVYTTTDTGMKDANNKTLTDYIVFANNPTAGITNMGLNPCAQNTDITTLVVVSLGSGNVYDGTGTIIGNKKNVWDAYNKAHGPFSASITDAITSMQKACLAVLLQPKLGVFSLNAADSTMVSNGIYIYTSTQTLTYKDQKQPITDYLITSTIETSGGNTYPGDTIGAQPTSTTQGLLSLVTGDLYSIKSLTPVASGFDALSNYQNDYQPILSAYTKDVAALTTKIATSLQTYTAATTKPTPPPAPPQAPKPPKSHIFGPVSGENITNPPGTGGISFGNLLDSAQSQAQIAAPASKVSITKQQQVASGGLPFNNDLFGLGTSTDDSGDSTESAALTTPPAETLTLPGTSTAGSSAGSSTTSTAGSTTGSAKGSATGSTTGSTTGSAKGSSTTSTAGSTTGSTTGSAKGSATSSTTGSTTGSAKGSATSSTTGSTTGSAKGSSTTSTAGSTTGSAKGSSTTSTAGSTTGSAKGSAAGSSTGSTTGSTKGSAAGSSTGSTTGTAKLATAVGSTTGSTTGAKNNGQQNSYGSNTTAGVTFTL